MQKEKFILCPVCGNKTRVQIREDTELKNFPLFCPKCHKQTLINAKQAVILYLLSPYTPFYPDFTQKGQNVQREVKGKNGKYKEIKDPVFAEKSADAGSFFIAPAAHKCTETAAQFRYRKPFKPTALATLNALENRLNPCFSPYFLLFPCAENC